MTGPVRAGDDLQVHPLLAVLAGVEGPVGGDPVDGHEHAVDHHVVMPGFVRRGQRLAQFGDRVASMAMVSVM